MTIGKRKLSAYREGVTTVLIAVMRRAIIPQGPNSSFSRCWTTNSASIDYSYRLRRAYTGATPVGINTITPPADLRSPRQQVPMNLPQGTVLTSRITYWG